MRYFRYYIHIKWQYCFHLHFRTRTQNQSSTAIDTVFIDTYKFINYTLFPVYNGLSDRDAELLIIKDVILQLQNHCIHTVRNINKYSLEELKIRLSYESWDSIFGNNNNKDVDSLFSSFCNNYLRIVYSSFPPQK